MMSWLFSDPLPPGTAAPDFSLPDDTGRTVTLSALRGRSVVLVFYPADSTPNVLESTITGELDDVPVAQIEVRFNWQSGKLNRVELSPLEPL